MHIHDAETYTHLQSRPVNISTGSLVRECREQELAGGEKLMDQKPRSVHGRAAVIAILCMLALPVFLSACIGRDEVELVLDTVDNAIQRMQNESADWQNILRELKEDLPDDIQSTIRNEVSDVASRAIAAAGAAFRCNEEFIREQIISDLYSIRAKLTGQSIPEREPRVCHTIPDFVDAARVPDPDNHLEFDGYNFDESGLTVLHERGSSTTDVSQYLDRPEHYKLTLNLGSSGVQLNYDSRRFILIWNGETLYTIGIEPPPIPEPISHVFRITGWVDVNDDDWGDDQHNTFAVDWGVELTPGYSYYLYQNSWCVDEVRGEMDLSINLDPATGLIYGNGVMRTYEDVSGSCGGNDLDKTHTFNFEVYPFNVWAYSYTLEDAGDYAAFDLTFHNQKQ
jgi:hypothetical protein